MAETKKRTTKRAAKKSDEVIVAVKYAKHMEPRTETRIRFLKGNMRLHWR